MAPPADPCFRSVAVERTTPLDFADVHLVPIPPSAPDDPAWWATRIFDTTSLPGVAFLLKVRQAVVGLIGIERESDNVFAVHEVVGGEALIVREASHLDFRVGVAVTDGVLRVTTAVTLHGWRGRLYWSVTRLFHGPLTEAMMRRAARQVARASAS